MSMGFKLYCRWMMMSSYILCLQHTPILEIVKNIVRPNTNINSVRLCVPKNTAFVSYGMGRISYHVKSIGLKQNAKVAVCWWQVDAMNPNEKMSDMSNVSTLQLSHSYWNFRISFVCVLMLMLVVGLFKAYVQWFSNFQVHKSHFEWTSSMMRITEGSFWKHMFQALV